MTFPLILNLWNLVFQITLHPHISSIDISYWT